MLQQWLGDVPVADFLASFFGRAPLARPSAAAAEAPLLQWETVDRLLRGKALDVLVVRGGREWPVPPPADRAGLSRLLASGLGLVVRRAERADPGLAALGARLGAELAGTVHVQLFVTAAGTSGFGWHYDAEDVFLVQTHGTKDVFFRRNTLLEEPAGAPGAPPDFARVREETSPHMTCRLLPGDWLYLPRRWWHVALARSDSLSISLGVSRAGG